jgi:adenylate cyclase
MPQTPPRGLALLRSLLRERNQFPGRAAEIDRRLETEFGRRMAVLVLDMCGFSRLTARRGILFYLSMIVQMEDAARPAVANNGGVVVKQEADNLFALFRTPAEALEAALDIFLAFRAVNSVMPDDRDIRGSIGIGYGDLLVVGDDPDAGRVEDVFGHEMNLASRLGEDLASGAEILLTPAACAALPPGEYAMEAVRYEHRGEEVACHRFVGRGSGGAGADAGKSS